MHCPGEWMEATLNIPSLRATSTESLGDWTWVWFGHVHLNSLVCGLCKLTELTPWHWASAEGFSFHCYFVFSALSRLVSIDQTFDLLMTVLVGTEDWVQPGYFPNHMALSCTCLRVGNSWDVNEEEAGDLSAMALMAADRQGCSIKYKLPS